MSRIALCFPAAIAALALSLVVVAAEPADKANPKATVAAAQPPSIAQFVKLDTFHQLKISPTGEYLAATAPIDDKTVLVIIRRRDMKQMSVVGVPSRSHIEDFWWVNDTRVLLTMAEKNGAFDQLYATGEIYGTDVDGKDQSILVGQRKGDMAVASRIKSRKKELIFARMVNALPHDDDHVLISVFPLTAGEEPFTTLQRMHVRTGAKTVIARAPVRNAEFVVDHEGVARFAQGAGIDRNSKLYYRSSADAQWELINDESRSNLDVFALGFSAGDKLAYLYAHQPTGPSAIHAFDVQTRKQTVVVRDEKVDPAGLMWRADLATPFAVSFEHGQPRQHFLVDDAPETRLLKSLQKSFPGHAVEFTGFTRDGNLALVYVYSDQNPGDFYVFDIKKKEATHLASRREWVKPEQMATMRTVSIPARDGRTLHGYLSIPAGSSGKGLPLVVNPHGGPFGIADQWGFQSEPQLLASRGYAVLQVNFRGSGNYGREHERAGYQQWGLKMQDDVADATRWAIGQGIADKERICIYGASYGGYASLMGAAKDPDLYQCAVGYIGVYDLPLMHQEGDIRDSKWGKNFLSQVLGGNRERLAQTSPTRLASKIKIPVFLAAGGIDERAPLEHSEMMRDALVAAGNKPEWLVYKDEGHGFYQDPHRVEYYTKLLAFLDRHIGPVAGR